MSKSIDAPVLHVNADDPESVVAAIRLAVDYRYTTEIGILFKIGARDGGGGIERQG